MLLYACSSGTRYWHNGRTGKRSPRADLLERIGFQVHHVGNQGSDKTGTGDIPAPLSLPKQEPDVRILLPNTLVRDLRTRSLIGPGDSWVRRTLTLDSKNLDVSTSPGTVPCTLTQHLHPHQLLHRHCPRPLPMAPMPHWPGTGAGPAADLPCRRAVLGLLTLHTSRIVSFRYLTEVRP